MPCFPDKIAFDIIRAELGRPLEEVFSSFSERPIAAASLGQVWLDLYFGVNHGWP